MGQELTLLTNEAGEVVAQIPQGASVLVEADKEGFDSKTVSFDVSEPAQRFPIILSSLISLTRKTITLTTPDGALLQEEATVTFRCGNLGIEPPEPQTVRNGIVEVSPDPNCGELCLQVDAASYKTLSMRCIGEE